MLVPRGGSNTLTGGGRTNTWDGQNRLTQCVYNGTTTTHTYGSDGLRRRTVEGATTTDYVLDGQGVVRTLVNNVVDRTYLHGARGPEYERIGANDPVWYLYDGLGSVLGTVDQNGAVVSTRKYDVYGAVRGSTGPSGTKHKFVGNLGHPSEDETGLVYMRARYMDPVTGRFVSQDPALHGPNWFAYCANNPVNKIDIDGKVSKEVWQLNRSGWALAGFALAASVAAATVPGAEPLAALAGALALAAFGCFLAALLGNNMGPVAAAASFGGTICGASGSPIYGKLIERLLATATTGNRMCAQWMTPVMLGIFGYGVACTAALAGAEFID